MPAPISTGQRIVDIAPQLADGMALAGWAAAYVLGTDWLDGTDPRTGCLMPIEVANPGVRRRNLIGLRYRAVSLPETDVLLRHDLPITQPLRTAFDGARWAPSVEEAVVFLDAMLKFGLLDLRLFADYAREHKGWTGIGQAIGAAVLAEGEVRSTWESRLRVCYQIEAGLPRPLTNAPIFDPNGTLLGIADLFDPEAGLVTEFDGQQHREREQHRQDNIREERFEDANLTVVRSDSLDLTKDRTQLIHRMQGGHQRGLARDRSRDRWTLTQRDYPIRPFRGRFSAPHP